MLSFVVYFETLLQLSLHFCQFTCTLWNLGKKQLFIIYHIEAPLFLKNAWLPTVLFLDFNSRWYDLLVSRSHYEGKKYFPLVGTVLKRNRIHLINSKWRIQVGGWFQFFFDNKWLHHNITAIIKDYLTIIPRVCVGHELAIIISYPKKREWNIVLLIRPLKAWLPN